MGHQRCVLALLLVSIGSFIFCRPSYGTCNDTRLIVGENNEWDQFVLSLQWPITACKKMNCQTSLRDWTIHGLWPGYSNRRDCPTGPIVPYDKSIESMPGVKDHWPDLKNTGRFWKYEWDKHGMCATESSKIADCRGYFKVTTDMFGMYNPMSALGKNGITPTNTKAYKSSDIMRALNGKFRTTILRCFNKGGKDYLGEIHFCFTKTLGPKSCRNGDYCGDKDENNDDDNLDFNVFKCFSTHRQYNLHGLLVAVSLHKSRILPGENPMQGTRGIPEFGDFFVVILCRYKFNTLKKMYEEFTQSFASEAFNKTKDFFVVILCRYKFNTLKKMYEEFTQSFASEAFNKTKAPIIVLVKQLSKKGRKRLSFIIKKEEEITLMYGLLSTWRLDRYRDSEISDAIF